MSALSKIEIVTGLTDNASLDLGKREAKIIVEGFFNEIAESLIANEEVKISGLGNFITIDKKSRPGRNPRTGRAAMISARRVVSFKAGQKLKEKVAKAGRKNEE